MATWRFLSQLMNIVDQDPHSIIVMRQQTEQRLPDHQQDKACDASTLRAIRDVMETLNGSWKLSILLALKEGTKRFRQIDRAVDGISDKMLSKELLNEQYMIRFRLLLNTKLPNTLTLYKIGLFAMMFAYNTKLPNTLTLYKT